MIVSGTNVSLAMAILAAVIMALTLANLTRFNWNFLVSLGLSFGVAAASFVAASWMAFS